LPKIPFNLDKCEVDLHQSAIQLHRKSAEVNILTLAATLELNGIFKAVEGRCRAKPPAHPVRSKKQTVQPMVVIMIPPNLFPVNPGMISGPVMVSGFMKSGTHL
jgi:hypothetical protein